MIVATALWRRLDLPGHDACQLRQVGARWSLSGHAVFKHPAGPASLAYSLVGDADWSSRHGRVHGVIGPREFDVSMTREDDGWVFKGRRVAEVDGLVDLDFGFTPATNLPPLRRARMRVGDAQDMPAAWLDIDAGTLTCLPQRYARTGELSYDYEAPSFDYRATLDLAPSGFVRDYPSLWVMEG